MKNKGVIAVFCLTMLVLQCKDPDKDTVMEPPHQTTPFLVEEPAGFPPLPAEIKASLTEEAVALGRQLFYEKALSQDSSISCASCHAPEKAFSDTLAFSKGINGQLGDRNAMPLFNLAYGTFFFWDGRASTLTEQALEPVPNPVEMHLSWPEAVSRLAVSANYRSEFSKAFGPGAIRKEQAAQAMAQFMTILLSGNAKFDRWMRGETPLTPSEIRGFQLFQREGGNPDVVDGGQNGADCFHCHSVGNKLFTDFQFHNNGLDSVFTDDSGAFETTGDPRDRGHFKTPSLRNLSYTAPYMHDGRFNTLEEVIDHYNTGGKPSETIDPFMKFSSGGLNLSEQDKQDLIAFLKTLDDPDFVSNPQYQKPE